MTQPAPPKRPALYPTRSGAGALLGQQLAARGYIGCILLGVTPEGVEIAANAAKAMGAQFDVLAAALIAARGYEFACPTVVMDAGGHPAPYGDVSGDTPERLRSIMIAHQAA